MELHWPRDPLVEFEGPGFPEGLCSSSAPASVRASPYMWRVFLSPACCVPVVCVHCGNAGWAVVASAWNAQGSEVPRAVGVNVAPLVDRALQWAVVPQLHVLGVQVIVGIEVGVFLSAWSYSWIVNHDLVIPIPDAPVGALGHEHALVSP